ncbi:AAA family ATPase [uncultured Roseibium sp.]|uniref:AAA family ATPase n=1 Tax=uncultured Roseibium sp. TaxID=1936171 RepID=UPI00261AA9CF|nr:AAA family ATPase [uncultured Roseibium sp.]
MNKKAPQHRYQPMIRGFSVTDLFGMYTYDVALPDISDERGERIILIYGDNGSGKTTIVNLIYHLLSRESMRGHRSYIARTQFKDFTLKFSGGLFLVVTKNNDTGLGSYRISLLNDRQEIRSVAVSSTLRDDEYSVKDRDVDDVELEELYDYLFQKNMECFLMADSREFHSDFFEKGSFEKVSSKFSFSEDVIYHLNTGEIKRRKEVDQPTKQLKQSVARVENWIKNQALEARSANDASMSDIYKDLITRLGAFDDSPTKADSHYKESLIERLKDLAISNQVLSRVGMASSVPVEEYKAAIENASSANLPLIAQILTPYIDSVQARIDSMKDVSTRLHIFTSIINKFYKNKSLHIDTVDGISINAAKGGAIEVDVLSSGEKHLLILMCNILLGTSQRSLFLVDEPELSLNIKWQRMLVDALLDLSAGTSTQFFMATHSIELLAEHRNSTLRLDNLS